MWKGGVKMHKHVFEADQLGIKRNIQFSIQNVCVPTLQLFTSTLTHTHTPKK